MRELEGVRLRLRLVQPGDAAYIHGLRVDPTLNRHLSEVQGTIEDQRAWIEAYKAREAEGLEYYYLIERRDDSRPCGVVRIYDIEENRFTWGSWILDAAKPPKAALESAVLVYMLGFDHLATCKAVFDVRRENERVIAFHHRFGATKTRQDAESFYFELCREDFIRNREKFLKIIQGEAE